MNHSENLIDVVRKVSPHWLDLSDEEASKIANGASVQPTAYERALYISRQKQELAKARLR